MIENSESGRPMLKISSDEPDARNRGSYSAVESLRLLNFTRSGAPKEHRLSRQTVTRWIRGYEHGEEGYSEPLWTPDYANDDDQIELSFRDLIELRFVKAFRDLGIGLPTIRDCYRRAVEEVQDERPFSTQRFRTDGKTIFLDITEKDHDGRMIDLKRRQQVFRSIIEPSLRDLEFDASTVSRWYPLGIKHRLVVIDPKRSFGRPIVQGGVPTEVLAAAVAVEGSVDAVARLYEVAKSEIRSALEFEQRLAA
ncbi:DUF433 domain-containing protein [Bradyrhizobium ivorense]|uniref:DUF433 domain-containing protein n=1 Tax=Bradyrhizobium ivorense TaxID=2511166 RepID=UPI0010B0F1E1|nr:hypothetical protein [Bradyrhizobium ivorense]VIO74053.1 Putative antitoxin VapB45 [Bradyrhizobium ivorense]